MINLRHIAVHHNAQVMQYGGVLAVLEIAVDVKRGVPLALDTTLEAHDFVIAPLTLTGIEPVRLSEFCQQVQPFGFVVCVLDDHLLPPAEYVCWRSV
ncbi:hypothetical protein [Aquabacterium sp.]|uniref:hypothetical protein n=1 Tax=Aquabacterium sp. TaxID=1872578 RepID=UPI0026213649|nr:hypothetical protein [Aquabacterium sp.]MDD2977383.1 hypothetical protein [Aquabacterium sp.]